MARKISGQDTPRVALAQVEDLMKGSPGRADALRGDGLQNLVSVRRAKLVQTRRERARLAVRHGEDSAQVERIDRQMAAEHRFLVNTRAEADRVSVPMLERDDKSWKVHGFVRSGDGVGRRGVTVTLVDDAKGKGDAARATTDKRGYFLLELGGKAVNVRETARASKSAGSEAAASGAGSADDTQSSERLVLRLASSLERDFYLATRVPGKREQSIDPRPLHPFPGGIAYRDLTISNEADDGKVCQLRTQFLGNSSTREFHDLAREQPACNIARIRPDHRFYLQSIGQARKLGYDFCAKCFGPEMSER